MRRKYFQNRFLIKGFDPQEMKQKSNKKFFNRHINKEEIWMAKILIKIQY